MADELEVGFLRRRLELISRSVEPSPLSGGGGGGTSGGMEARVAALEAHVAHIQTDVSDLKADVKGVTVSVSELRTELGRLTVKVEHLPSREDIGKTVRNWLAVAVAAATLVNLAVTWAPRLLHTR